MITWQFNLFFLQQLIEDPITLSDVKSVAHFVLPTFRSRLQARAYRWFIFQGSIPLGYAHVGFLIIRRLAIILDHVNMTLVSRLS
jgi:hypothetical protein